MRGSCCTYNTEHICMSVAAIADKTKHSKRAIYRFRKMSLMIQADMCAALVVPTTRNIYVFAAIADKTKHGKQAIYRFRKMSLMIQADMCVAFVVPTTRNIYVCQL
ncbi:hypothetical protein J6590_018412 [Homalodisca vitripennis]|nr:hypothetical protein J6590_018412 [Homalodisca vitripennis]